MDNIFLILEKIKNVFKINEGQFSSLLKILANLDSNNIFKSFGIDNNISLESYEEINIKINTLNSLILLILENPKFNSINDKGKKELLLDLYEAIASLYEHLVVITDETDINFVQSLVLYALFSYLADKQTISDLLIKENYKRIKIDYFTNDILLHLEVETYRLLLLILSNIKNHDGLMHVNNRIQTINELLEEAQKHELENNFSDINRGLRISAIANIIHLSQLVKEYLFTGKVLNEETSDIKNLIQIYSYNAYNLLNDDSSDLKLISYLIKYSFTKIAEDSIWNIASKSPLIREFIEAKFSDSKNYIYTLLPSQRDSISDVLTTKKSVIVNMPTSSGKSLLAEMQILFFLHNYRTSTFRPTICYIVPTNALMGQVKNDLEEDFSKFNFKIETVLPYYDIDEIENEILSSEHIDILVSTPEKLEALIRQNHPSIANTKLVILDEAHNISSTDRGSKFELVLSTIKQKMNEVHFMLLSPFIENAQEIAEWLGDSKNEAVVVSMEWTPTKQYVGCNLLNSPKNKSFIEFFPTDRNQLITNNVTIDLEINPNDVKSDIGANMIDETVKTIVLLERLLEQSGNILVLCKGQDSSRKMAETVLSYFKNNGKIERLFEDDIIAQALEIIKLESDEEDILADCISYGICYHNSGLSSLVKETIEELIRLGKMKIIFATTTLAQGMNFPIKTVLFNTTTLGGGANTREMSIAEFWNIAGRAGRAYKDKEGYIILSYANSQRRTRETTKKYISGSLKEVISSLTKFFEDDKMISFDYEFLKERENAPMLNLLQYMNHIINISYNYNIDTKDLAKIRTILNNSFLYHNLDKAEGFIKAQTKINAFVGEYINHIKTKQQKDLKSADELGISDVSFSKVKSMITAFTKDLESKNQYDYKVSEIILKSKNINRLSEIIFIISRIPEIKIEILGTGKLDSYSISEMLIGWVNGNKVSEIARKIKREDQTLTDAMNICNKYLNGKMKSFMPWGINIYQSLTYDMESEDSKLLPSYIYYGVSDKESVLISKLGVPRFAVKNVKEVLNREYSNIPITVTNLEKIREIIRSFEANKYNLGDSNKTIIKSIVDSKI
ncbi:DEAD/DEAH box helicase [Tissierella sp.]|uniref:DEAD/DEAH box helicase n=1 Tax=Tissierella sp. TaxID=41274 RepID=UPI00304A44A2